MKGAYVMTQSNCEGKTKVEDCVAMAAYTLESHNCERIVITKNGMKMVNNEGNVEIGGLGPYPVSYRSVILQIRRMKQPAGVCLLDSAPGHEASVQFYMVFSKSGRYRIYTICPGRLVWQKK